MPSDLRKPLLGRQKKSVGINRRFSVIMVLSVLAVFSIGGLSVYTALSPGNLQKTAPGPDVQPQPPHSTPETAVADGAGSAET
ncbi:MAG: divergent polysaccharide deacetylase family protein, partial [Agrobacterium sp.]|nr:divergent polysaccharide deacetylase family protein [Agrobacterium sp.]